MAHIQILFSLLSLLGITLAIEKKLNIRFSTSLLYGAIFISILLYVGSLANYLEITATTIRIVGWISLIAGIQTLKNRKPKADEIYIFFNKMLVEKNGVSNDIQIGKYKFNLTNKKKQNGF